MKKIQSHLIGIDQGEVVLFNDFVNDGVMWAGTGDRELRRKVEFSESYGETPVVSTWISLFDISSGANSRADVRAEDVHKDGFTIVFNTWSDTRIARVRIAWQSIGALKSEEDLWDV